MISEWSLKKLALISLVFMTAAALLMWGVWELEERKKPQRTKVLGEQDDGTFVVELKNQDVYDIIVWDDDKKLQDAFRAFAETLELEGDYPPIIVPGGPMVLAIADQELPEELEPAKRAAIQFLKRHAPRRVVLVAHRDSLLYDMFTAWADNYDNVAEVQHDHLIRAKHLINGWLPHTEVLIYYADIEDGLMTFYPMADELPLYPIEIEPLSDRLVVPQNKGPERP